MNASRIAGEYLYPSRSYNTAAVQEIKALKTQNLELKKSALDQNQIRADYTKHDEIRQSFENEKKSISSYESFAFKSNDFAQKGLLLNILG